MRKRQTRIDPKEMTERWRKTWRLHVADWLVDNGDWPRSWPLHAPTETEARTDFDGTSRWVETWRNWARRHNAEAVLIWESRHWRGLGNQKLPARIVCGSPHELASWIGEDRPWRQAVERFDRLTMRYPSLAPILRKYYSILAHDAEIDQRRVESMLDWLLDHPASGLYPRQLPISGMDTKWLNAGRKRQLKDWLSQIRGESPSVNETLQEPVERASQLTAEVPVNSPEDMSALIEDDGGAESEQGTSDFYSISGLRAEPSFLCLRILDPELRSKVGGLSLLSIPPEEAVYLAWSVGTVLVVENLTTGWALGDLPDTVAVIGRGYAVGMLDNLPWLHSARIGYWGDIDTHGFGILSGFRTRFPRSQSMMMDMETLVEHQDLCVKEGSPHAAAVLPGLTPEEATVYAYLKQNRGLRLEQERIAWNYAWPRLETWVRNNPGGDA